MIECPPNMQLMNLPTAPYGRYEVVLERIRVGRRSRVAAARISLCRNDQGETPIEAGPDGAILMLLAFDEDACEGGLTGEGLSVAAAAAMERAI